MKTKFLSFLLGLLILSSLLTSCGSKGKDIEEVMKDAPRTTQTLVVYLMSEKEVPEATEHAVEDAINKLTKAKFKTQLDLRYFTEDEYYKALEGTLKEKEDELKRIKKKELEKKKHEKEIRESCKEAGIPYVPETTKAPDTAITEEETLVNQEYGIIEYKYPDPEKNQVDIFYLGGYDRYQEFIDNEWIARLNDEVDTSSKKLKEHIPAIYLDNLKESGIYGIPNNTLVGEYTWMLLDKELMDKYWCTPESINDFTDPTLYKFLSDIKKNEPSDKIVPIKGTIEPTNIYYWSFDDETLRLTNQPGIMASYHSKNATYGSALTINNLFATDGFQKQIKAIKRFELEGGFYAPEDTDKRFAMTIVKGGYELYQNNIDKYYVKLLEYPQAYDETLVNNMLCVNELEDNVSRTMEIVTYINTVPEARNILQYGVLDENYYIDDDNVLHRYNDTYMMDVNKTGNIFMAHPEEGLPADFWNNGIRQNQDAIVNPVFGFRPTEDDNINTESLKNINALYEEKIDLMYQCKSLEELDEFFKTTVEEIKSNPDFKAVRLPVAAEEGQLNSLNYVYFKWLLDKGFIKQD